MVVGFALMGATACRRNVRTSVRFAKATAQRPSMDGEEYLTSVLVGKALEVAGYLLALGIPASRLSEQIRNMVGGGSSIRQEAIMAKATTKTRAKPKARPVSREEPVQQIERNPPEAPNLEQEHEQIALPSDREPFGRFLLSLRNQAGWVQALADGARTDPKFPKDGDPEAVRARLRETMAEGDMFEAVDDAETDWLNH